MAQKYIYFMRTEEHDVLRGVYNHIDDFYHISKRKACQWFCRAHECMKQVNGTTSSIEHHDMQRLSCSSKGPLMSFRYTRTNGDTVRVMLFRIPTYD